MEEHIAIPESPRFIDSTALFSYTNMVFLPSPKSIRGDLLLAAVTSSGTFPVVVPPEGFIPLVQLVWAKDQPLDLYWKWSTGEEPETYYWQVNAGQNIIGVSVYRGVHPTNPCSSCAAASQSAGVKVVAPSILVSKANSTVVAFFTGGGNGSSLFDGPAGMTARYEVNDQYNLSLKSADSVGQPAGFSDAKIAVMTGRDFGGGVTVALTPSK